MLTGREGVAFVKKVADQEFIVNMKKYYYAKHVGKCNKINKVINTIILSSLNNSKLLIFIVLKDSFYILIGKKMGRMCHFNRNNYTVILKTFITT